MVVGWGLGVQGFDRLDDDVGHLETHELLVVRRDAEPGGPRTMVSRSADPWALMGSFHRVRTFRPPALNLQLRSGSSIRRSRRRFCSSWLTFTWGAERVNDPARGVDAAEDRAVLARWVHRLKGQAGRCVAAPPRGAAGGLAGAWSGRFGLFGVCAWQAPSRPGHRAGVRWWSHRGQKCRRMAPASARGWIVQDDVVVG